MMVDVIHHLEEPGPVLESLMRRLRPGGRLLIFEPNKLNPLISLYHALDRNEWGLLRLGTPRAYRKMLSPLADLHSVTFNGIVIGPKSNLFPWISSVINRPSLYPYLGWLNPKLFIVGRKPARRLHEEIEPSWFSRDGQGASITPPLHIPPVAPLPSAPDSSHLRLGVDDRP
jgi:SAM-dependent methyltransferase